MADIRIDNADLMKWLPDYIKKGGPRFHAVITDPPYNLDTIKKRFGKPGSKPAKSGGETGVYNRSSKGFMNQNWDTDIAFDPAFWGLVGQVMLPGAFGAAFASSRGWHRMASAIEDSGLIIHPTIFGWVFGSGFPKATRIDTQIDAKLGYEPAIVGKIEQPGSTIPRTAMGDNRQTDPDLTTGGCDQSALWNGYRYGLQALKPALEPIIVFQRPFEGSPVQNMMEFGAGGLNIAGTRIGDEVVKTNSGPKFAGDGIFNKYADAPETDAREGRWPANFYISADGTMPEWAKYFLHVSPKLDPADPLFTPIFYSAKASSSERNAGLDTMPDITVDAGRDKSIDNAYLRGETTRKNPHPTVKPLALTQWLARLFAPPPGYPARLFVPFAGVGSEMIGAALEGWQFIQGVELTPQYVEVANARLSYWLNRPVSNQLSLLEAINEPV